jgi:hypothetical protein
MRNKKIREAGSIGTVSDFWHWIATMAHNVYVYASEKKEAADIRQSELLNEVNSMDRVMNPEK